jgi:hypothetical protein
MKQPCNGCDTVDYFGTLNAAGACIECTGVRVMRYTDGMAEMFDSDGDMICFVSDATGVSDDALVEAMLAEVEAAHANA